MTDLGPLNYLLETSVTHNSTDILLSQRKYATKILERARMLNCKPCRTLVETNSKLGTAGPTVSDPREISGDGHLVSVAFLKQDLEEISGRNNEIYNTGLTPHCIGVLQIYLFMHDPREPHLAALRWIMRYIRGTLDLGLQLFASSTTSLVAYSDAD
ncbi:uncharacterized mitochondrial protein AtMg00810-like [Rutidosis leptorrhynchoides]|uniref:uncharacterized mitochondrial protein AtMg00810-like n=1 Tax=Rutidosis leptorrhynchoides TaxID=125765 RepID=UPI003A9A5435